jgi:hypothetical protein
MLRFVTAVHPQIASIWRVNFETSDHRLPEVGFTHPLHELLDRDFGHAMPTVRAARVLGEAWFAGHSVPERLTRRLVAGLSLAHPASAELMKKNVPPTRRWQARSHNRRDDSRRRPAREDTSDQSPGFVRSLADHGDALVPGTGAGAAPAELRRRSELGAN